MKVLNLYAGLGGNRKLWPDNIKVTAVEINKEVACIYAEYFPQDEIIIGDAHDHLLRNYDKYDFIWTSPPCPTHSRARFWTSKGGRYPVKYPEMDLYQEIILLKHFFKGGWVAENVIPYYDSLIKPDYVIDRHSIWSNLSIPEIKVDDRNSPWTVTSNTEKYGFSVKDRKIKHRKDQLIRNLVHPDIGLHILNQAV